MTVPGRPTPEQAAAYAERLEKVVAKFDALGRGARQDAAFDLRMHQSRVSGMLLHREYNVEYLDKLEEWADRKLEERGVVVPA